MNEDLIKPLLVDSVEEESVEGNIEIIKTSNEWNTFRKDLTHWMYNAWS